jgi:hypothetical protein
LASGPIPNNSLGRVARALAGAEDRAGVGVASRDRVVVAMPLVGLAVEKAEPEGLALAGSARWTVEAGADRPLGSWAQAGTETADGGEGDGSGSWSGVGG